MQTKVSTPVAREPAERGTIGLLLRHGRGNGRYGWMLAFAITAILVLLSGDYTIQSLSTFAAIYAVAALGQEWLLGRAHLVSFAGAATMGTGAYTALLISDVSGLGAFPFPLIGSLVAGAIVGFAIGIAGLRFQGVYLVLASLAFQFIFVGVGATIEGADGPQPIAIPSIMQGTEALLVASIVLLAVVSMTLHRIYSGAPGRQWMALHERESAARVVGVDTRRWSILAFVGSSMITAVAGAFLAYALGVVDVNTFSLHLSVTLIIMAYVGGVGTIAGPILGAALVTLAPYFLQNIGDLFISADSGTNFFTQNISSIGSAVVMLAMLIVLITERGGLVAIVRRTGARVGQPIARMLHLERLDPESANRVSVPVGSAPNSDSPSVSQISLRHRESPGPEAPGPADSPGLWIEELFVDYKSGARAVDNISLHVGPASAIALVGRNGAGKTSILRAIAGFLPGEHVSLDGVIRLNGTDIFRRTPLQATAAGVVYVPERRKTFPSLTVRENIILSVGKTAVDEVYSRFPHLAGLSKRKAGLISGGERQMLALGIASARHPRLLLIDEASLGLAPALTLKLYEGITKIVEDFGSSVVIVDSDSSAVPNIVDRVYQIDHGQVVKVEGG